MLSTCDILFFDRNGNRLDGIEKFSLSVDRRSNVVIATFYRTEQVSCCVLSVEQSDKLSIHLDYAISHDRYGDIREAVECINKVTMDVVNNMNSILLRV